MNSLTGSFGRWTVVQDRHARDVLCRCHCGIQRLVSRYALLSGTSKSCGCWNREVAKRNGKRRLVHVIAPGDKFGRLTVVDPSDRKAVVCTCECGRRHTATASNLLGRKASVRSCGCLKNELIAERGRRNKRHGLGTTDLYRIWKGVRSRCSNPRNTDYLYYGARGVKLHPAWEDPAVFVRDVVAEIGERPRGLTLDRVNNDGNYEPGNIRWATRLAQARNRGRSGAREPMAFDGRLPVARDRRKLTGLQVQTILSLVAAGETQTAAAARFGVSQAHVSRLVREARPVT